MPDRLAAPKFAILREIFQLAQEQRDALAEDRLDRFRDLMDRRDELMEQLHALARESQDLPANIVALPSAIEAGAEDTLALDAVLRGIMEQDAANEALLQAQMDEVSGQLPQVRQGRRAAAGYRVSQSGATYIDRVS
ncbi:MAG: hypothetical protein GEU80_14940 [Dehalococcoidia bacterium]|nr:hypothetical protein [Dehalococcoidia bacterium]